MRERERVHFPTHNTQGVLSLTQPYVKKCLCIGGVYILDKYDKVYVTEKNRVMEGVEHYLVSLT